MDCNAVFRDQHDKYLQYLRSGPSLLSFVSYFLSYQRAYDVVWYTVVNPTVDIKQIKALGKWYTYLQMEENQDFEFLLYHAMEPGALEWQLLANEPHSMFKTMFWHSIHVHMQNCSQRRFRVSYYTAEVTL